MKLYQVKAIRSGGWWALSVDELPGAHSQSRTLRHATEAATEAIALLEDVDPATVSVVVTPVLHPDVEQVVIDSRRKVSEAQEAQQNAAALSREAARMLLDKEGLSQRDAADVLGVSFQRVNQLVKQ